MARDIIDSIIILVTLYLTEVLAFTTLEGYPVYTVYL